MNLTDMLSKRNTKGYLLYNFHLLEVLEKIKLIQVKKNPKNQNCGFLGQGWSGLMGTSRMMEIFYKGK